MTTTRWTPGPWSIHGNGDETEEAAIRREGVGTFVAHVFVDRGMPAGEARANAALLSAAPELHAALAGLVDVIDRLGPMNTPRVVAARAALAKANGGVCPHCAGRGRLADHPCHCVAVPSAVPSPVHVARQP